MGPVAAPSGQGGPDAEAVVFSLHLQDQESWEGNQ